MSTREDRRSRGQSQAALGRVSNARVLVIADHALLAAGLRLVLSERRWDVEVSIGGAPGDVIAQAQATQPDCVLLSVHLGGCVGARFIAPLVATGTKVLLVTAERRRAVLGRFLEAGAAGWIGRDTPLDDVDATLRRLVDGKRVIGKNVRSSVLAELRRERERELEAQVRFMDLTRCEARVLAALTDGLSAEEIARENFVAVCTVRSQIRGVLQKLDVRSQLAAVALANAHRELLPRRGPERPDRRTHLESEIAPDVEDCIAEYGRESPSRREGDDRTSETAVTAGQRAG